MKVKKKQQSRRLSGWVTLYAEPKAVMDPRTEVAKVPWL